MSRNKVRFTAWLSEAELEAVHERGKELGESASHVVRIAIRQSLGLPDKKDVTSVTRNNRDTKIGEP